MKSMAALVALCSSVALAETTYRYERKTRASDFAEEFFGKAGSYREVPEINIGRARAGVSTSLDCGRLDLTADLTGEFQELQRQVSALIPQTPQEAVKLASSGAMMAVCYAYPTVCAQLRHDFLALQTNLNLRAQACKAMDDYIDVAADKGAKQLRAEAQAECVRTRAQGGMTLAQATRDCQNATGLPLRDFQAGLEKKFTDQKQLVLKSIVDFSKRQDRPTYDFLAATLGEIEVQPDGYWQPLFQRGLAQPSDIATTMLAKAEARACGSELKQLVVQIRRSNDDSLVERSIDEAIVRRLTPADVENLDDLGAADRKLACAALGRAIGQVAAQAAAAKAKASLAAGLLNTAIPDSLRQEYRTRGEAAFDALKKSVESDQIPPVEDVRAAIAQLARAAREKNRILASQISAGRISNYRQESDAASGCYDTLSCVGG